MKRGRGVRSSCSSCLMFIGASAGSTAGGMKVIRLIIVLKFVYNEITQAIHPHAVLPVRLGKTVVPRDVTTNVVGFFVLYLLLFALGVLSMTALGLDLVSAFGAAAATLGNIGPGLGSVGPTDTYAHIPCVGQVDPVRADAAGPAGDLHHHRAALAELLAAVSHRTCACRCARKSWTELGRGVWQLPYCSRELVPSTSLPETAATLLRTLRRRRPSRRGSASPSYRVCERRP